MLRNADLEKILANIRDLSAEKLSEMERHFTGDVKLTFIARLPEVPNSFIVVTSDEVPELARDLASWVERGMP